MLVSEAEQTTAEDPSRTWLREPGPAWSSAEGSGAIADPVLADAAHPGPPDNEPTFVGDRDDRLEISADRVISLTIDAENDQDLILLRRAGIVRAITSDMLTTMEAPGQGGSSDSAARTVPGGLSAFVARVLDQLTLSAWLPGALLAASAAVLLQFQRAGSASLWDAVVALTANPVQVLVIMFPLLVIATIVTQAFSFEAIQTLEGYWRRRGISSFARTAMIRWHASRKRAAARHLNKAYEKALAAAKTQMLDDGIPSIVYKALRNELLDKKPVSLSAKKARQLSDLWESWRSYCRPWHLARIDRLLEHSEKYPEDSRILPTKLGNLMRATEDNLKNTADDLEGFVFQRYELAPRPVQLQHDQYRNRLEMYCVLVFVSVVISAFTPVVLLGSGVGFVAVAVISSSFAILGVASYLAAIASANGYCAALRQMDKKLPASGEH